MARKDRGRKEVKRPKQDKAKKRSKKPSVRGPLREPERPARSTATPQASTTLVPPSAVVGICGEAEL